MRRRITLLVVVAVGAVMLLMTSAMALAATIDCTPDDPCRGTPKKDTMDGTATTDEMIGLRGDDKMEGLGSTDS
jgi:Ca2+-binding RTX toxin-like protein